MAQSKAPSLIAESLRGLIRGYQYVSAFWGPRCRFYPSCSEYTREALAAFGVWKGLARGTLRILKCHPWHPGGVDLPAGRQA